MRTRRPKVELMLTDEKRSQLQCLALSRSLRAALSARARIVLNSADGELNSTIAERLELTKATVGKWRARLIERRIPGLHDDVRLGKPRMIDDERVAHSIKTTLHTKPANGSTHWSVRTVAAETAISKTSVARYFQLFGLQPHRTESFKLSNDPFFTEKLRDLVGLYLSPPDNALAICVDEKSQCQALERIQSMLQPPGVLVVPARDRQGDSRRVGHPRHRRQLRYAQPSEGRGVAGDAAALAPVLHPDLQVSAQSGQAISCADRRKGHSAWRVHQRQKTSAVHRPLRYDAQHELPALQVVCHG